ncbi:DNA replication/repair protein RecF [Planctomonas psychrotolerans]|uniref:DNA replication/repair protein RecF n=1 Tax=Planctomonas psychrotolerans TaxID=2528712 RepID=UPI001238F44C|nr:DNA replication/repair protein RecF [Planctomonas psychrotolerans]
MLVRLLSLTDFRNYRQADVLLEPGANLFVGSNGQGKTNLVEALGYLSTLGSHRVSTDAALIRMDAPSAIIRARLEHEDRQLLVEVELNRGAANRAQVNRSAVRTRELPRYFSSVLFAPEDLALVRGDPGGRRRFLDQLLVLRTPRLAGVLADYDRVLRQRNSLLKSARARGLKADQLGTLDIWDERLVSLGAEIIVARARLVGELTPEVQRGYEAVAGADHGPSLRPALSILGADPDEEQDSAPTPGEALPDATDGADVARAFTVALERLRRRELDRGVTLAGPHRDDVVFTLNGLPAKGYASHGESWSFALALKLASAELLRRESTTGDPVLMLDDVFAELDEARRARLANAVGGYGQVLITAAVYGDVPEALRAHTVHIEAGRIVGSEPDA